MVVWEGEHLVAAGAQRGSCGVRRGSALAERELQIALESEKRRACPDRGWVKLTIAVVVVSGGMVYLQD
jgi:hypothetical protein